MNWLNNHLGSMGYAGDFYIPQPNSGAGDGTQARNVGDEQIKRKDINWEPRIIHTDKYDFPRIQKFFDWEHFLDWADWKGHNGRRYSQKDTLKAYDRTMTRSFAEAMNLARYGWTDGLRRLDELKPSNLNFNPQMRQNYDFQIRYNVAGGAVNVGRFLTGIPDCMRRINAVQECTLPARIQKILIYGTYDAKTQTNDVIKHGYAVYQIIEALEMANIQTDVSIAFVANKCNMYSMDDLYTYETYIKIKETTDILYPEKLLFCVAHPSMLRRLVFSEWEKNKRDVRQFFKFYDTVGGGYGSALPQWTPPQHMLTDTLFIPSLNNNANMGNITEQVRRMIKAQYEHAR